MYSVYTRIYTEVHYSVMGMGKDCPFFLYRNETPACCYIHFFFQVVRYMPFQIVHKSMSWSKEEKCVIVPSVRHPQLRASFRHKRALFDSADV